MAPPTSNCQSITLRSVYMVKQHHLSTNTAMKQITTPRALQLLLSSLHVSSLALAYSSDDVPPVLDTDGNKLLPGVEYFIEPAITDVAGPLTLAGKKCPGRVALAPLGEAGYPVVFLPADPEAKTIGLGRDVNVVVQVITICITSTAWALRRCEADGRYYVVAGGQTGNPGKETLDSWFSIESYQGVYKLVYCPTVCEICRPVCGSLGVYDQGGKRWLGIKDQPFPFQFRRAQASDANKATL